MRHDDNKENVEFTEEEVEQIYQFDRFLYELPEHIRCLVDGKSAVLSVKSLWKKKTEVNTPDYIFEIIDILIENNPELVQQIISKAFEIMLPYRLNKKDFELIRKKLDELQDFRKLNAWFLSEYGSMLDEVFENEYGNSYLRFNKYLLEALEDGALGELSYRTLTKEQVENVFLITKENWDEYKSWVKMLHSDGLHAANTMNEEWTTNFLYIFFHTYYLLTEQNFNNFFQLMQNKDGQLTLQDSRFIYDRLKEHGIAAYVQQRYNEYRRLKGAVDLSFYPQPKAEEVYNALSKYYPGEDGWELQAPFFTFLLQEIIHQVRPNLKNADEAVGFILILWNDDKHFDRLKKEGARFATFRKDMAEAFQLEHLGNLELSQGKPQVQKSSLKVWDRHHTIFSYFVDRKRMLKKQNSSTDKAF